MGIILLIVFIIIPPVLYSLKRFKCMFESLTAKQDWDIKERTKRMTDFRIMKLRLRPVNVVKIKPKCHATPRINRAAENLIRRGELLKRELLAQNGVVCARAHGIKTSFNT